MFEEIPFVLGFLLVSLVLSVVFFNVEYKPLKIAVQVVAIVGVIVHEISHVLMCIITNTKINNITLLKKVENERPSNKIYGGQVNIQPDPRISFMQALVVGLAPLFISFWIFFFFFRELSNPNIIDLIAIFYVLLMVSLILGAAPSKGDLHQIVSAFTYDIGYTLYQIFLVFISIFSVMLIVATLQIPIIHESINYFFVLIGYNVLKYMIKGVNRLFNSVFKKIDLSTYHHIKRRKVRRLWRRMGTEEREAQW